MLLDLFSLETKYLVEIVNTYMTHYLYTTSSNFLNDLETVIKFKIKIQDDINYKTKLSNILTDINNNLSIFSEYYEVFKKMAYRNPKDRISLKELYEHQIFNTFANSEVFPIISKQLFNNNIICEKYPIHKYARKLEIINMNNYIQKFTFLKSYHKILAIATVLFDKFMNNYNPENTILLTDIIALSCSIISTSLFSDIEVDIKSMLFDMRNIYCYNDLKNCIYNIIISINGILYFPTFTDNLENIDENKLLDTLIENMPPYNNKILLDYYTNKSSL